MDDTGKLYFDENPSEEDRQRVEEWGKEIEADELERQRKKLEEFEKSAND